jgi:hypothetical protein
LTEKNLNLIHTAPNIKFEAMSVILDNDVGLCKGNQIGAIGSFKTHVRNPCISGKLFS